jgi:hypothetical protein
MTKMLRIVHLSYRSELSAARLALNSRPIKNDILFISPQRICSSDSSSLSKADDDNKRKLEIRSKRNKLSPTNRIQDLLSENECEEFRLHKNTPEETSSLQGQTDNTLKLSKRDNEHCNYSIDNPVGYNPTNPRSAKNLSYLERSPDDIKGSLPYKRNRKRQVPSGTKRKDFRTLSVADRIERLQGETNEEKHEATGDRNGDK